MKKNTHYFNGQKSKRKIVYGKEKAQEYNAISQEIEKTFCNLWRNFLNFPYFTSFPAH